MPVLSPFLSILQVHISDIDSYQVAFYARYPCDTVEHTLCISARADARLAASTTCEGDCCGYLMSIIDEQIGYLTNATPCFCFVMCRVVVEIEVEIKDRQIDAKAT
jgi:hypothetical protein